MPLAAVGRIGPGRPATAGCPAATRRHPARGCRIRVGAPREVGGLRIVRYDIPRGCAAGYFPELNPLVPLWHRAVESQVPAYKAVPIRLSPM